MARDFEHDKKYANAGAQGTAAPATAQKNNTINTQANTIRSQAGQISKQASTIQAQNNQLRKDKSTIQAQTDRLNAVEAQKPGAYQSSYAQPLKNVTDQITNREKFSYNLEDDPLFQQYKQMYTQQGLTAMQDTMGQAAAMTGGYGNSYAAAAGQQAYQAYMQQLNAVAPDLYNLAMQKYQMEGDDLYRQAGHLQQMEQSEYGRYSDDYNRWAAERDYTAGRYDSDRAYQRQLTRDQVADDQWRETFNYGKTRDQVADDQWRETFNYGKTRDQVADDQWRETFGYQQSRDKVADDQWRETFDYGKTRDQVADDRYKQEWQYGMSRDQIADEQWQKTFDEDARRYDQEWADYLAGKGIGNGGGNPAGNTTGNPATGGYDTHGYDKEQIKQMQNAAGITADGIWGPDTQKAYDEGARPDAENISAQQIENIQVSLGLDRTGKWDKATVEASGYSSPAEAYKAWNAGKLGQSSNKYLSNGNKMKQTLRGKTPEEQKIAIVDAVNKGDIDQATAVDLIALFGI